MNEGAPVAPPPDWAGIGRAIEAHHRFLITTHVNPDGDGLGAELGLWAYLRALGKDARIVNPDAPADRYRFLDDEGQFEVWDPRRHAGVLADREVVFVLDISRWDRLGALGAALREAGAIRICIDHHPYEGSGLAHLYGVDVTAAATGQLVYEMVRHRGHVPDLRMATGFYVSILTDTGSFRFANSDGRAHRAAAELLGAGLNPSALYEHVYGNWSLGRLRLLGEVLRTMRAEDDGVLLLLTVPRALLDACAVEADEAEGFVDVARSARPCRAVALLLEREDGGIKASLRSRGDVVVNRVAARFGGGGHRQAAGATLAGPMEAAADALLGALREEIALADGGGESA